MPQTPEMHVIHMYNAGKTLIHVKLINLKSQLFGRINKAKLIAISRRNKEDKAQINRVVKGGAAIYLRH